MPSGLLLRATEMGWKFVPMFMAGINSQPVFLFAPEAMPQPRSTDRATALAPKKDSIARAHEGIIARAI